MKRWLVRQLSRSSTSTASGAGYTITEVLIVLAVTTIMFVAIAASFQGRQARVEFTQAVRSFEAKLQNVMSDSLNGTYELNPCSIPADTSLRPVFTSNRPGDCIFLGKMIVPAASTTQSAIYTLAGRRTTGTPTRDVYNLAEALPAAHPNYTVSYTHPYRLRITRLVSLEDSSTLYAFGFLVPLPGSVTTQVGSASGDRQVTLMAWANSLASPIYVEPKGLIICLRGQNDQRAEVTIGDASSQTNISSILDTANTGVCQE